jgi:hypothetical protein
VTKFNDLFDQAKRGKPDPNWDFEPDNVMAKKGGQIVVVNQGGEPHTFTEVKQFGGGFIGDLNGGEPTVSECSEDTRTSPSPGRASCKAASSRLTACRKANIAFSAASIPGCAWQSR